MWQFIGFLSTVFAGATWLNRIIEGQMIGADEIGIMNTMTITHSQTIFGLFSVPVINTDFFFVGIPRLVKWDYSFFGGNSAILQYFLYSFTFALTFALFILIAGMVFQFFSRR